MVFRRFNLGRNVSRYACIALTGIALSIPAYAQSLDDELTSLIATHPAIASAREQMDAAKERIKEAEAGLYYPTMAVTADSGPERYSDSTARTNGVDTLTRKSAAFTISQNLFNGFSDESSSVAAEADYMVAIANYNSTLQQQIFDGVSAYLNVLRTHELVRIAMASEENIQEQLNLEDERVQRGSGITVDVLQAKSRLQQAKERRISFEGRLRTAEARFEQVFSHPPEIAMMRDMSPPPNMLPSTLEDSLGIARENNLQLSAADAQIKGNSARTRQAASGYYPTVDLVGKVSHQDDVAGDHAPVHESSLLLTARWELFSGFRTKARVAAASKTLASSKSTAAATLRRVEQDTRIAWNELTNQRERVQLLLNAVSIAQEVYEARKKLRKSGKETAINVLDAESEVFNAELNLTEADYDARVSVYRLARVLGILTPETLGITVASK